MEFWDKNGSRNLDQKINLELISKKKNCHQEDFTIFYYLTRFYCENERKQKDWSF